MVFYMSPVRVDIRCQQRNGRRGVGLKTANEVKKYIGFSPLRARKCFVSCFYVNERVMNMHRTTRFIFNRFDHKSGKAIMSKCSLSNQVFEIKNFVCELYWIAVSKVDFQ